MTTTQRHIPANPTQIVKSKDGHCIVYLYNDAAGRPCARAFSGRRIKPDLRHWYANECQRTESITRYMVSVAKSQQLTQEHKAEQKRQRTEGAQKLAKSIKIGDIFVSTLSYNMTFNTFYQVVGPVKGLTLTVIEIPYKWVSGDAGYTGNVQAVPIPAGSNLDDFEPSKLKKARICGESYISVQGDSKYARLTTADAKHYENHND